MSHTKAITPTKAQVMMPYLGQKMVLTEPLDSGLFLYSMGNVGMLDAFQYKHPDRVVAMVIFEDCPIQDCVEVEVENLMPLEFLWEGYTLQKQNVTVKASPNCPQISELYK